MNVKRVLLIVLAVILLILGVIGLFAPFLQGILFIAAGLFILSAVSPVFKKRLFEWLAPYPRVKAKVERIFAWLESKFGTPKA